MLQTEADFISLDPLSSHQMVISIVVKIFK